MVPVYLAMAQGSTNYKVDVSWSNLNADGTKGVKDFRAILDTGAAPVVIRRGAIPENILIQPLEEQPFLIDAQRRAITILGVVSGLVTMETHEYAVDALVASELSVDLLLGTEFIDKYVHVINARRKRVLMNSGIEVSLVGAARPMTGRVLVAESIVVPPKSEAVIPVRSEARGLCLVTTLGLRRVSVTNGLHQLEGGNFLIKVANFSEKSVRLSPGMVIGMAETHFENTLMNVEEKETSENVVDWKKFLDLEGLSDEHKKRVTNILDKYAHLWDQKRLGVLHGTRHRIETKGSPVFQHPYRAGPGARQAEKDEMERMLKL